MKLLRALLVEDDQLDAQLVVRTLERGGYEVRWRRVETRAELDDALVEDTWDVVLSDHALPQMDALEALRTLQAKGHDLPFIVVSGTMSEEIAASAMRAGAHDFLTKGRLARLVPAVERELRDAATRHAKAAAERARREAEARMATIVTNAVDAIITTDARGIIESVNPATEAMFGWPPGALVGLPLAVLLPVPLPETGSTLVDDVALERRRGAAPGDPRRLAGSRQVLGRRHDGSTFPVDLSLSEMWIDGERLLVGIARDLTERTSLEQRLQQLQHQDLVTTLPNRKGFLAALDGLAGADDALTIVVVEIDRLRLVADSFGQDHAEAVLLHLAERLRLGIRTGDLLASVDTGVFAVACPGVDRTQAEGAIDRFRDLLRDAVEVDGMRFYPTGRIATASSRAGHVPDEALLSEALAGLDLTTPGDALPSTAPAAPPLERYGHLRLMLETDLQEAVRNDAFWVAYQPEIDLRTGRMTAVEALVRWDHPQRGNVPPSSFIPLAERMGLVVPLGSWVLRTALAQLSRWRARPGGEDLSVAVNISGGQLARTDVVDLVLDSLAQADLPGSALCLEVTESAVLEDIHRTIATLSELQGAGVRVAVDDFGTGYSSLDQLKHLPVHTLKIDRSFVDGLPGEADDLAIVQAVLAISSALGLETVAEGVETRLQLDALATLGCTCAQGFFLSRPVAGPMIDDLLDRTWLGPA